MEKINKLLNQIYGSNESAMTFYLVLGLIALFFIIVIIVTLAKSKKENNAKEVKEEPKPEVKENSIPEEEIKSEEPLSETQIFNNILMGKEDKNEEVSIKEMFENTPGKSSAVYLERPTKTDAVEDKNEEPQQEEVVEPKVNVPSEAHEEVVETTNEQYDAVMEEINSTSEYVEEDKPVVPSVEVDDINEGPLPIREDYTIEMPKVKPIDIDTYLNRRAEEEVPVKEEPKQEEVVKLSNDDIKARLAKLKQQKEVKEEKATPDGELQDLMKAVGLENTPVIDNEEKHILGR